MSSSVLRASRPSLPFLGTIAAGLLCATALAGCSADVARLDMANLGYNEPSQKRSAPMPSEPMRREAYTPPAETRPAEPYSYQPKSYRPYVSSPAPVRQAALPQPMPSSPPPARSYQPAPAQPAARDYGAPSSGTAGRTVEVVSGDTVYGIARRNGVSIAALMSANGLKNPTIFPGQKLTVPEGGRRQSPGHRHRAIATAPPVAAPAREPEPQSHVTSAPSSSGDWSGTYTVTARDSLYAIARRYRVRVAELRSHNGNLNPARLRAGTVLKVPGGPAAEPSPAPVARTAPAPVPLAAAEEAQKNLTPGLGSGPSARPRIINATDGATSSPAPAPEKVAIAAPRTPVLNDASPAASEAAKPKSAVMTGKFRWPAKGRIIAGFGPRPDHSNNDGINILVPQGSSVLAAESGTVAYAGNELKGYGNLVLIRHAGNWVSAYAHNETLLVRRGDHVDRGQEIAKAGKTGAVDQPQLHFELRQGQKPVDPIRHLEQ